MWDDFSGRYGQRPLEKVESHVKYDTLNLSKKFCYA